MPVIERVKEKVVKDFFRTLSYPKRNVIDGLLDLKPFDFSVNWSGVFLEAMRYSFDHHYNNCEFYRKLCSHKGFDARSIRAFDDIWDIPFIMTDVFKMYSINTRTRDLLRAEFNSSGTSGRKSRVFINIISGQRLLCSAYRIYKALGLADSSPVNYLMMGYNPGIDGTMGTTQSDIIISYLTPRKEVFYAIDRNENGDMEFLKDKTVEKLKFFVDEGLPIRILGFIHHTCEVIREYNKKYGRLLFPPKSYILTGGGWKKALNAYGKDFDLFAFIKANTNMDPRNVRDLYTLNEHAVFYLECEEHNMHIPNVSLACARNPRNLRRLPDGETGLIQLYTPLVESMPFTSVMTTDYGFIGKSCACRAGGPYIKITGRAEMTPKLTCAFTADRYIENSNMEASLSR